MGFFSIDGKFFRGLTKAADFFILAFLGFIFSLPIITAGASITAVYYVALKVVRNEEGYIWRDFWKSWKQNFLQGTIVELVVALLGTILCLDVYICYRWTLQNGSNLARAIMFVSIGLIFVLAAVVIYIFPVLAKFDNKVIATFKNALILSMHHFPQTFAMIIINGGLIYFSVKFPPALMITVPAIYFVDAYIISKIFIPFINGSNKSDDNCNKVSKDTEEIKELQETDEK